MGSCLSTEPAVAESRETTAASPSPPAPREPEKNKALLPETQAEQLKPTSEPPSERDEDDDGLGYDHAPIKEEVCLFFVRALFSHIFVTYGDDFLVFLSCLYALVLVSTQQHFVAGVSSEKIQSLCETRGEDPQVLSFYH
jgi:hypothetical protein